MAAENIALYRFLGPSERYDLMAGLRRRLPAQFRARDFNPEREFFPSVEHLPSGLEFKLVIGGTFTIGLSEHEKMAANAISSPPPISVEEMSPPSERYVKTLLVSVFPVLEKDVPLSITSSREAPHSPVFLPRERAIATAAALGCRLPSEAEWEYCCRGGRKTLFCWGDHLLSDVELSRWLPWDFSNSDEIARNDFGLGGFFSGEWCEDEYRPTHASSPFPGVYVVKGGGAYFWPWQDDEWVWCMPAMRMPSTDLDANECGFRVVADLLQI